MIAGGRRGGGRADAVDDGCSPRSARCLLIQLQILLDCSDGELARWRGAVLAGRDLPRPLRPLGDRGRAADRARASASTSRCSGSSSPSSCCSSRARPRSCTSRAPRPGSGRSRTPSPSPRRAAALLARLRRGAGRLPFYRAFVAIEFTALVLVAAILDVERELLIALVPIAAITALGHLAGDPHLEAAAMTPWGCVVLTRGDRPEMLDRAVRSLLRQRDVEVDVAVVGNGWEPEGLPDGVKGVELERGRRDPGGPQRRRPRGRGRAAVLPRRRRRDRRRRHTRAPFSAVLNIRGSPRDAGTPRCRAGRSCASSRATAGGGRSDWVAAARRRRSGAAAAR